MSRQRSPAAPALAPRRAFLAFEGGGAKGLVHLGALHAIEDTGRFAVQAFSGTSAGAMVAALAAAGYSAEDLFALDPGETGRPRFRTILDDLGHEDATRIFGEAAWRSLSRFRALQERSTRHLRVGLIGYIAACLPLSLLFGASGVLAVVLAAAVDAALIVALLLWGGADLCRVRDAFDEALLRRFPDVRAAGRRVAFRDMPNLKLCAANLTRGRLEVFSQQTAPDVAVADAVCASICFPFAFRPWRIERPGRPPEIFLDGGLLSNLPAWPFDEERRLDPDALTLAIAIGEDADRPLPSRRNWIGAMLRTAISGGEVLSTRGAGPIEILRLETGLRLLAFDLTKREARAAVEEARKATAVLLRNQVLDVPDQLRTLTASLRRAAHGWQAGIGGCFAAAPEEDSIRIALAVPEDHLAGGLVPRRRRHAVRSLTLRFGAGFEEWADEGLVIPVEGSTVGAAWLGGDAVQFLDTLDGAFVGPENRHRRRLLRRNLAWVVAVAVTLPLPRGDAEDAVDGVLVVDGTTLVPYDAGRRQAFLNAVEDLIEKEIKPRFPGARAEDGDGQGSEVGGPRAEGGRPLDRWTAAGDVAQS